MRLPDEAARRQALTAIDRTMLVEAGAGSGKTAILAGRIAVLLVSGVPPRQIAAITFTELAASELEIRIQRYVIELAQGRVPRELAVAFPDGLTDAERRTVADAAETLDQLTATTIHGFAQALIRPYPAEADIDPGAEIIDPAEADLAFAEQFDAWLRRHLAVETGDDVIAELVLADEAAALALLRELAQFLRSNRTARPPCASWDGRLFARYRDGVAAFRGCLDATGFREETSEQYLEHFAQIDVALSPELAMDAPGNAAVIGVLAAEYAGPCFTQEGRRRRFQLKTKWRAAARAAGHSQAAGDAACDAAQRCYEACHDACEALRRAAAAEALGRSFAAFAELMGAWRNYKRSAALLDFDDLLYTARDLLARHEPVRRALGQRFGYVLVDEFQDTDPLQIEILWLLCGEAGTDGGEAWPRRLLRPGALFLVGDPKQAIYRFRGADVGAYTRAREALGRSALCEITANFRSRQPILDFINARFAAPLATSEGQPGFTALSPVVAAADAPHVVRLDVPIDEGATKIDAWRAAEARVVADLCRSLIGRWVVRDPDTNETRPCRAGDIALLAPAGTDLWRYEETLEAALIAVSTQAGKSLFLRQEIQDLIALTRALADSRDTLALGALLRGPLVGLSEAELLDIAEALAGDRDRPDALAQLFLWTEPERIAHPLAKSVLSDLQSIARQARSTTPHLLLSDAIERLSVRPQLRRRHRTGADRALANVDLFLEMARSYGARGLRAFARDMRANWEETVRQVEGRPDAAEESVALVTIHAAKGLEWPVVIPINMMGTPFEERQILHDRRDGRFSSRIGGMTPAEHDGIAALVEQEQARERLRLWYVAATRARDLLVLAHYSRDPGPKSWARIVRLDQGALPAIDPAMTEGVGEPAAPVDGAQSRAQFVAEAARIAAASGRLRWQRPSRDEGVPRLEVADAAVFVDTATAEQAEPWPQSDVAGGAVRGTILHKMMEEVLTGETPDDRVSLLARAMELLGELAADPVSEALRAIAPDELAETVLRTLALPEIALRRARLRPESTVWGAFGTDADETLISGIADALELDDAGRIATVIDWKSDIAPGPARIDHYLSQIEQYRVLTGASRGLLVFMTPGRIITLGS